jgi:hypothetical protein
LLITGARNLWACRLYPIIIVSYMAWSAVWLMGLAERKYLMRRKAAFLIPMAAALAVWTAAPAFAATGWVLQSTPNPSGVLLAELGAVSCTSASFCIAVGNAETSSGALSVVVERWNGSTWALQSAPSPAGAYLEGVSCTSTTDCEAVGGDNAGSLAEHWNGSTWATQTIPGGGMSAVSCTSSSYCEAVGGESAEHWNGSNWAAQTISTPAESDFTSISCSSSSACTAVGTTFIPSSETYHGLAERWNGSTWTSQTFALVGEDTEPFGVSCGSATSCVAVGYYYTTKASFPLAEYWNGSTWTSQTAANSAAALYGVSCISGTNCTAAGVYDTSTGVGETVAESWNGSTWTLQSTPNVSGAEVSALQGISCPSATDCTAAGYSYVTNPNDKTLAEQWTG